MDDTADPGKAFAAEVMRPETHHPRSCHLHEAMTHETMPGGSMILASTIAQFGRQTVLRQGTEPSL